MTTVVLALLIYEMHFLAQIRVHYHSPQSREGEITVVNKKISEIKTITSTWPVIEFQCTCNSLNWAVKCLIIFH